MGRRLWLTMAYSSLLLFLASCQGVLGTASGSPGTSCSTNNVRQVAEHFIDAFNRGDLVQLDQLVSDQQFGGYSTDAPGQRLNAEAMDRSTLMAYFTARHQQHEHLMLNALDVTFTNDRQGGFSFQVTRSADDGVPPSRYSGKGGVQCATMPVSLIVWAMSPDPWSPIELLPVAAAAILVAAAIGAILLWRRRSAQRRVHVGA
jgi:hypothetical protein